MIEPRAVRQTKRFGEEKGNIDNPWSRSRMGKKKQIKPTKLGPHYLAPYGPCKPERGRKKTHPGLCIDGQRQTGEALISILNQEIRGVQGGKATA